MYLLAYLLLRLFGLEGFDSLQFFHRLFDLSLLTYTVMNNKVLNLG